MSHFRKDWIEYHARTTPTRRATLDTASGRQRDYKAFHDRVGRVAGLLRDAGVTPGDRVGVLALNSTDVLDVMFAAWRIGAVHLALNFRLTPDELAFIVNDAEPTLMITDVVFDETVAQLKVKTDIDRWISIDGLGGDTEFERGVSQSPIVESLTDEAREQSLAMLMYSSGTTGRPKGVMITHENIFYSISQGGSVLDYDRNFVSYAAMPLFHIAAVMGFSVPAIFYGAFAIVERAFDPGGMLKIIDDPEIGLTHFVGVPAMMNLLLHHPDAANTDFSRIKGALSGAEAVPESILKAWFARGVRVQEVYGMTETTGGTCVVPIDDVPEKIGSSGKPMLFSEFKIMTSDTQEAAMNEVGEIWMRGPVVTPGYWRRPEANADAFVDGWLRSGDIGRIDADGYIYVEDRVKDMYISGGENVYPAEIENVLYQYPEIHEVAVVGVPDEQWGEAGCVVAVFKAGQELNLDAIVERCEGSLARFKQPKHLVIKQALPRNATGKVLKFVLRDELKAQFK